MNKKYIISSVLVLVTILVWNFTRMESVQTPSDKVSFFITSTNPNGGNLGGLTGADNYCKTLAANAGLPKKDWVAYLSTVTKDNIKGENASDRIGSGPWYNYKGELIAENLEKLINESNITKQTALNEKGEIVNGRGDTPNVHDILTGSDMFGKAMATSSDTTCENWTLAEGGSAIVGHHDRVGRDDTAPMKSWVSAHGSRGCSVEQLKTTGGEGLVYCFAR